MISRVSPLAPNRNHPPAKSTDTGVPASGDDGSISAVLPDADASLPVVAGSPNDTPLLILEDAKRALAEAKTVDEVISIQDKAIGLVAYAKRASNRQLEAEAAVIRMEAERRLGQMMQQQKETVGLSKGGRPKTGVRETPVFDQLPTLAEAGIDKNLAKRARAAAALSDEEFQAGVKAKRDAVRTGTGSRKKSLAVKARAPIRRERRRERKPCTYLQKWLSQISEVCKYDDERELPSDLDAAEIDAAIATVTEAIGELNKLIGRLEEARPQK